MGYADSGLNKVVFGCHCAPSATQPAVFSSGFGSRRGHFNVTTDLVGRSIPRAVIGAADLVGRSIPRSLVGAADLVGRSIPRALIGGAAVMPHSVDEAKAMWTALDTTKKALLAGVAALGMFGVGKSMRWF